MLVAVFQEHIVALTRRVIATLLLVAMAPGQLFLHHPGQGPPRSYLLLWLWLVLKLGLGDNRVSSERLEPIVRTGSKPLALSPAM
jgi:hypothetical protein